MYMTRQKNDLKNQKQGQYKCDFCEFTSNKSFDINLHEHETHKQSTIKCNLCDFRAKNKEILRKHHEVAMGHKKQLACKYFLNGMCRYGKFCRFEHKTENTQKTNILKGNNQLRSPRNTQCKFFENCQKFPNCGYMHYEVCKYQENCTKGERCNFIHLHFLDRTLVQNQGW